MPPSILSSEALVIWMFRMAMNAPIMAAITEIHTKALARSDWGALAGLMPRAGEKFERVRSAMVSPLGSEHGHAGLAAAALRGEASLNLRLNGRDHRHAGAKIDGRAVQCD